MADKKVSPEIIAIITAAVQSMTGGSGKVVAVKVKQNPIWTLTNRIKH
ncbi:MAG: hypothetical protein IJ563_06370 [Selenomonadaceae bacterium]|nr:hypothetical protein [Selenomonadaceae bacterium]